MNAITDSGVWIAQVHPLGAGEQPVQARDLNAGSRSGVADRLAAGLGNVCNQRCDGKGGDLQGVVAGVPGLLHGSLDAATLEYLAANGKFHARNCDSATIDFLAAVVNIRAQ